MANLEKHDLEAVERDARIKRAERLAARRLEEENCAWDFRVGDELTHAESCVFVTRGESPCSRTYDPGEEPDRTLYEGTGIGALFGMLGSDQHMWQLAGWNIERNTGEVLIP